MDCSHVIKYDINGYFIKIVGVRIPAAYAFPLLPLVFPDEMIKMLPVASFVAGVFLFGAVLLYKKWEMKQKDM